MFEIFQIPFMQKALIVSLISGGFLSFLGVYIVLRKIVFVGFTLSQIAACGFAFGYLLGISPSMCSVVFSLVGVGLFSIHKNETKIPRESVMGLAYALSAALTVLFVAKSAKAESHMLNLLSGNILTVTDFQIYLVAGIFLAASIFHFILYRQFIFISFDPETAETSGFKTGWWNFVFYGILGITISVAMRATGVLLTFAYLVIPAMIALVCTQKMRNVFIISIISGLLAAFTGLYLSFRLDLPSGPTIVSVLSLVLGLVFVIKK